MNRPAILIAHMEGLDPYDNAMLDRLDTIGRVLNHDPITSWDDPRADELLAEAEILLGHWGTPLFGSDELAKAPNLKYFAYAAGTVKWYTNDAIWERDLLITSGANANAEPVAQYTVAAITLVNKGAFFAIDAGRGQPAWQRPLGSRPVGNFDKTIGLVSASLIGRRVAELLTHYDGLNVEIYDPFVDAATVESLGATKVDSLIELCARADIVSVHAPATPDTLHMIGADELAAMADGTTLINTARGHCVDLDALLAELRTERIGAVIDVTDPVEPLPDDHELRSMANVVYTPHIAGSQGTELARMSTTVLEEIERYVARQAPLNPISRNIIDRIA
jgi:phosphoglycerate dehydrogenase-like enzyme